MKPMSCPFCSSTRTEVLVRDFSTFSGLTGAMHGAVVYCNHCCATGPVKQSPDRDLTIQLATEAWNAVHGRQ